MTIASAARGSDAGYGELRAAEPGPVGRNHPHRLLEERFLERVRTEPPRVAAGRLAVGHQHHAAAAALDERLQRGDLARRQFFGRADEHEIERLDRRGSQRHGRGAGPHFEPARGPDARDDIEVGIFLQGATHESRGPGGPRIERQYLQASRFGDDAGRFRVGLGPGLAFQRHDAHRQDEAAGSRRHEREPRGESLVGPRPSVHDAIDLDAMAREHDRRRCAGHQVASGNLRAHDRRPAGEHGPRAVHRHESDPRADGGRW